MGDQRLCAGVRHPDRLGRTPGRLFGRRRIFVIGSAIFAVFSVLAGLADDAWLLLLSRAVMVGVAGFGNAVGPLLGGALTDLASWRWIFFLNLPIAAFAAFVTWRVVPAARPENTERRRVWRRS